MLTKCKYCGLRVRPRMLATHEKRCPKARALAKRKANKANTQSLEYRDKKLSEFAATQDYDLRSMSDNQFNELIDRLTVLREQKAQKEKELADKEELRKAKLKELSEKEKEAAEKAEQKRKTEEKEQFEQIEREKTQQKKRIEKDKSLQKTFEKQREVKPEKNKDIEKLESIDEAMKDSLSKIKPAPKKRKRRSKKKDDK